MRRIDWAVTDPKEITGIMSRYEVLHLAIAAQPAPYLLPVNYNMTLYAHGAMDGTKYALLAHLKWSAPLVLCWTKPVTAAP